MRCMICGAAALEAGKYVPPATLSAAQGRAAGQQEDAAQLPPRGWSPPSGCAGTGPTLSMDMAPPVPPMQQAEQPGRSVQQVLSYIPPPEANRAQGYEAPNVDAAGSAELTQMHSYTPMPMPMVEQNASFTPLPMPNMEDSSPQGPMPMVLPGAMTMPLVGSPLSPEHSRMGCQGQGPLQQPPQPSQQQMQQPWLGHPHGQPGGGMPPYMPPAFGTPQNRFYEAPGSMPSEVQQMRPQGPPMMGTQGCNINMRPPPNQPGINPYLMGAQDPMRQPGPPLGGPLPFGGLGAFPQPGFGQQGFPPKQMQPPFGPPQLNVGTPQVGFGFFGGTG